MASLSSRFARSTGSTSRPTNATAIVQGFGNVGSHAALGLAQRGVRIVGISDHTIALHDPKGFDVRARGRPCRQARRAEGLRRSGGDGPARVADAALRRARALRGRAGDRRRHRAPSCNAASSPKARTARRRPRPTSCSPQRNDEIFVIPDILCNAGGVIVSYFEWVQDLQQYFWSKRRSDGPARAGAGAVVEHGHRTRPPRRGRQPHGGDGDRGGAGAKGQAGARAFPMKSKRRALLPRASRRNSALIRQEAAELFRNSGTLPTAARLSFRVALGRSRHTVSFLELVLGRRLANRESKARKIGAFEGLPAMGLDGLGSSAYGPEAALTILMPLGARARLHSAG